MELTQEQEMTLALLDLNETGKAKNSKIGRASCRERV